MSVGRDKVVRRFPVVARKVLPTKWGDVIVRLTRFKVAPGLNWLDTSRPRFTSTPAYRIVGPTEWTLFEEHGPASADRLRNLTVTRYAAQYVLPGSRSPRSASRTCGTAFAPTARAAIAAAAADLASS